MTRFVGLLVLALLISAPPAAAQSLVQLRAGVTQPIAPSTAITAGTSNAQGHSRWVRGAVIGGLVGIGLAVLYHAIVSDSDNNGRRALEFGFGGAIIGALIAEH